MNKYLLTSYTNNIVSDGRGTEKRIESLVSGFLPGYLGNYALLTKIKKLERAVLIQRLENHNVTHEVPLTQSTGKG